MSSVTNASQAPAQFKAFVSEADLNERRRKRQEEWDKVRQPDQPIDAPEEEYDPRSLYERLQEQKDKKQAEFEETHKLKNMIRGLDDDEVQFLDLVDKTKEEMEAKILQEEGREIAEYRKAVASLAEEAEGQKLKEIKNATSSAIVSSSSTLSNASQRKSQLALLSGVVKRKNTEKVEGEKRCKLDDQASIEGAKLKIQDDQITSETQDGKDDCPQKTETLDSTEAEQESEVVSYTRGVTCLGVLPGLGVYSDSSDSEASSDSCTDLASPYDLLGRPRWRNQAHNEQAQHHAGKV